jgi:outer membrane protein assembly factor BamD (BamD/ComL family)
LVQEREVIAITALARLGRLSEAQRRAERFRAAYPSSPYVDRVDRVVPP